MKISIVRIMVALVLFATLIIAQSPTSLEEIPEMPGARYSENYTQIVNNSVFVAYHLELYDLPLIESKTKGYVTDASYAQVVEFYKRALDAKQSDEVQTKNDFAKIKNNSTAFLQYEDLGFNIIFTWIYKVNENEVYKFFVKTNKEMEFTDEGGNSTFYFMQNKYGKNVSQSAPTSAELETPLYPSAKYVPEQSLEGSRVSSKVFITTDPLSEVIRFYEAEFGKEAETEDNIFYGFQKYSTKYPDDVVYFYTDEKSMTKIVFQIVGR